MTIWAKPYLNKFNRFSFKSLLLLCLMLVGAPSFGALNVSHLFVQLSDVMTATKENQTEQAQAQLKSLQQEFSALEAHQSEKGKLVTEALNQAISQPDLDNLAVLSKALVAFEKEQNPVDYAAKRQQFAKRVMPVYQQLADAIQAKNLEQTQETYKRFNNTWTANEMAVRESSIGHYGKIETAMTLMRIAMLSDPANFAEMETQSQALKAALLDFKSGNVLKVEKRTDAPNTLAEGIALLEKSYAALTQNDSASAQADLTLFIQQWPIFEGEVSTRDGALYTKVESELPVILAKGNTPENTAKFQQLISELKAIDVSGSYGVVDAMLILLREGVEALLIIMALLTTLNVANQPKAKRWVYAGSILGIVASILGAIALQQLFPAISAGSNREIIEGGVGILAVAMMLLVGAWLHSKSSITGWKNFVQKHVSKALATGSLLSMLSLAFLSVFREGAETILFYVGMLPLISLNDLLLGIGLAILCLIVLAFVMAKSATKLPIHHLFKVMTFLIYALGFKILGVSVHALQLTNILPTHIVEGFTFSLPEIGFYPSWEGIGAQLLYLCLIPIIAKCFNHSEKA